jgi:hypothetical protein
MASFHFFSSLSNETPIMFNPFECNSLYSLTTFGFSFLHGPHQDAQKSMMVTFPSACFKLNVFPSGVFALKLGALEFSSFFFLILQLLRTLQLVFEFFYLLMLFLNHYLKHQMFS